jgi:FkbH-like protein
VRSEASAALAEATRAGAAALRAHARALAGAGDAASLRAGAVWLRENTPPSTALPWAAAFLTLGGAEAEGVALYEEWLVDAEAPQAWHVAQLARAYAKLGDAAGVFRAAARLHPWDLEPAPLAAVAKALVKARALGVPSDVRTLRMAVLSTFQIDPVVPVLRAGAARLRLDLDLHVADFDQLRGEIADPASALYAHDPEVVLLAASARDLRPGAAAAGQAAEWEALWTPVLERTRAHVLQHTFTRVPHSTLGHLDVREAGAAARIADAVNAEMADRAPPRVSLVDCGRAMIRSGADRWTDQRQWFWAKEEVSTEAAPFLVEEYLAVLSALTGRTRKVLVLDLDNTLWGGIVGEDGVEGLRVGPPSMEGEAHQELQRYARALKERGVLLAVCSKNDPDAAKAPFGEIRDMALKLDDFAAFRASWDAKPGQIRAIAEELNLGLDSFVFVDDNPAERALMRRECPEVLTIPLPSDPSGYVAALDAARAFEVLAVSDEDRERSSQYAAERLRREVAAQVSSPEAYHRSLEMSAVVRTFDAADQTRIVQLAARSNQFNVTTWRLAAADVERLAASPTHAAFTIRLRDRFGDYGLVALIVGEARGEELWIVEWAMSCRVIGRTVEQLVLAELEARAAALGCRELVGEYLPTKKNSLVKDLYGRLGFEKLAEDEAGATRWRRRFDPAAPSTNPFIRVERPGEESSA